ncbi:MAG: PAS domain S-box protein, partial [Pseudomonadales bacterium]|nr:PAS domain S-box protein [Pseudomonadales bacterium]
MQHAPFHTEVRASVPAIALMAVLGGGLVTAIFSLLLWPRDEVTHAHGAGNLVDWLFALSTLAALGLALVAFERHRALVSARRGERSFRDLYENVGEGVFRRAPDGALVAANPALVRLHGYDNEEELIRGSRDLARQWYVDPSRNADIQKKLLEDGNVTNVVSEAYRLKTRERIWIEESLRLVRDEKTDKPIFCDGLVREVTDAKRRMELQERYDKITSIISGYLLQLRGRPDGTFCLPYASIGLYRMFGIRPEDVVEDSTAYRNLIRPDDVERVAAEVERSRETLTPFQCEYRVRLADGQEKWVLAHCVPEREADGSTLWHGYVIDISEKKRSEERVYELAYFDALTHLPNRSLLRDRLRLALARDDSETHHGAVLFVDLDNF